MTWRVTAKSTSLEYESQSFHNQTRLEVIEKLITLMNRGYQDIKVEKE